MNTRLIMAILLGAVMVLPILKSCDSDPSDPKKNSNNTSKTTITKPPVEPVEVPDFNADSAYYYVEKQVKFGPRNPTSEGHKKCGEWIASEFRRHGLTVIEQKFQADHYSGKKLDGVNIIGQYRPELPNRILFAAHWDTRFIADQDSKRKDQPILGADDGGSGVGVLLELARTLNNNPLEIGVDFVCFDLEDQGNDADDGVSHATTWCLGSQYWAQNLHVPGYYPLYGILLDMVGGKNPRFIKEGVSVQAAPVIVEKVWGTANELGYSDYFINQVGQGITDDHYFVIQYARIPMIDIINRPGITRSGFVGHWHTHGDNMEAIDINTLKMVGEVCTEVIYRTHNGTFL